MRFVNFLYPKFGKYMQKISDNSQYFVLFLMNFIFAFSAIMNDCYDFGEV